MKNAKTFVMSLVIAAGLSAAFASEAAAVYCEARSPTGARGWARNRSLARAQYNALYQCAMRTPRGYTCYVTRCN